MSDKTSMDNIPEFHESDAEWETSEGAGHSEYDGLKRQYDAMKAREIEAAQRMRELLQRVADFSFLETLDATPTPKAREAYTRLMVDVQLAIREFKR